MLTFPSALFFSLFYSHLAILSTATISVLTLKQIVTKYVSFFFNPISEEILIGYNISKSGDSFQLTDSSQLLYLKRR